MTTFGDVLARQLRQDPGRPLVTFYDDATGERVELSVTTYANWVAKAASLLAEEHDLERGQRLCLDLPPHWLGPVFLGAAWTVGLTVVGPDDVPEDAPGGGADAVVCGPGSLERWAARAGELPVLACSLLPLGVRFADPVPAGVHDVGIEVWSQPDAFAPWDPPTGDDLATAGGYDDRTQAEIWAAAAAGSIVTDGGRLLSEANPASPPGLATFTEPLSKGGSLVLVVHSGPERLSATYAAERATARFP
ncbi:TIGR03089 family protein [Nocardioides sp. LMS-CY]|uniref:TIGR03089 family protein n=1 Tax=Nocardioides sp. (strain LMS-CY) TaxID=2840457 RepID=UPI001BFFDD76|nr:TIGR03089 family protein [Nocardioides sp. LMS-CY]QWF23688.1 TIGR03089 family protein [Nocardioides sp. LMS-CY]